MVAFLNQETSARRYFALDPRTKLAMLLMVAIFVLGGTGGQALAWARVVFALIPLCLLFAFGKGRNALLFLALFGVAYAFQYFGSGQLKGFWGFVLLGSTSIMTQFLPGIVTGYFVIMTTSVSEFVAAMQKMHVPDMITIPFSVMFRFFPTVIEEASSINDAMRMRGISLGGKHKTKMLEYRLVPMMTCSVRIGEELSAAALTRGLGSPVKRTNICQIGFHFIDKIYFGLIFIVLLNWACVIGGLL